MARLERRWRFLAKVAILVALTSVPSRISSRQSNSQVTQLRLAEPFRAASFPASVWFDARWPTWAHGYFARLTLGDFPAGLEVYDKNGKLVSQTYVSIPGATQLWLIGAVPSGNGGAIASGQFTTDEETSYFLAETSTSGGVVSTVHTETYLAARMCRAADGSIWTLGRDSVKESERRLDYEIVRQYSFEKGLLHSYVPRSSVNFQSEGASGAGEGEAGAFLVCGKDRISVFLNETKEYFEIDPSKEILKRWKIAMSPLDGGRVTGLAVTDAGRVYGSLFEIKDDVDTKTHGLFELQVDTKASTGRWTPVTGTLNTQLRLEDAPKGSFFRVWGADGDALVIRRLFDSDIQWVKVSP
jgi:hypothetical protein